MNDGCRLCHLVSAQSARRRKLTVLSHQIWGIYSGQSTFFSFDQELGLLDPDLDLTCIRAKVRALEGGDLEFKDLAVELAGGREGELGQGGDACMEDESGELAPHAGNAGKLGDRSPFLKMPQMNARSSGEGFLLGFGTGLAEELEGGGDPEFGQMDPIGLGEAGKIGDRPIGGFESNGFERHSELWVEPVGRTCGHNFKSSLREMRL